MLDNVPIIYHHFGDGPDFELFRRKLAKLSSNIEVILHGRVNNNCIYEFYKNNSVDIFINLSLHEGVPVSIMEAMSFGIPCLATNVGATREIVNNINGKLIESDFSIEEVVQTILNAKSVEWIEKRYLAQEFWRKNYNAEVNYLKLNLFFNKIK